MNWIKKVLFLTIGLSLSTFICVVLLELIFGSWLNNDPWNRTGALNIIRSREIIYGTQDIYGKNLASVRYTRDNFGLRSGCSKVSEIDILTIGGSTTDQRYVPDGMTYQDVLQSQLTQKLGTVVCVSNAGVDGHSTFGHLASFEYWFPLIKDLKPKYILFYVGINDAGFIDKPIRGFDLLHNIGDNDLWGQVRYKSAIYGFGKIVRNAIQSSSSGEYAQHNDAPPSKADYVAKHKTDGVDALIKINTGMFKSRFDKLLIEAKSFGAIPICVSQPHLFTSLDNGTQVGTTNVFEYKGKTYNGLDFASSLNALNNVMMASCTSAGGFFLDINAKSFLASDFYDKVHMGPVGAKKLGTYLYDEFVYQRLEQAKFENSQ
jgi:lysophospholipase L1-like esterase